MKSIRSILVVTAILVAVVTAYWYISSYKPKSKATEYIANLLNDPESAKFRNVRFVNSNGVCGEVNGKNGYGAYAGFTPFFYMGMPDIDSVLAYIKTDNPVTDMALVGNAMILKECTLNLAESKNENAPIIFDMGAYTVNLPVGAKSFNLSISLKLTTNDIQAKILANEPAIKSKIDALLKSTPSSDIATDDGKAKLANEIKGQIESVLGVGGISEVTFPNFSILW
jgi:flagellar basal body-associated protein FliL